ncbi:SPOR domain-containing protein [Sphingomonas sp. 37zxx]|uniref:SPOR domain-containing protein n=1 Tax=Sphingomonas sp. 37zxx TaxID=1550073 RepID=UPI00068ADEEE|nr:SPOR domain-containing protein [Sphingomonas sp. 37zxx]
MKHFRILRPSVALVAIAIAMPAMGLAKASQGVTGQAGFLPQPTPIADRLAVQMRTLAANPTDADALIAAGDLSAQLDDTAAALQFFARAEKVAPRDPRIAAGRGRALVRLGRPGEALQRFAEAEAARMPTIGFAADRGLAYDLIGQQRHAQAEYARALAAGEDAELRRRYALSLAISGDKAAADAMLDPQLRAQDRAAWRTRALVLAIGGNVPEAERVAVQMMPGFGTAYIPLFRRLGEIRDPADRAFAAHLGEFSRTPARLADATMAPALPPLSGAEREAPVAVAAATATGTASPLSASARRADARAARLAARATPPSRTSGERLASTVTRAPEIAPVKAPEVAQPVPVASASTPAVSAPPPSVAGVRPFEIKVTAAPMISPKVAPPAAAPQPGFSAPTTGAQLAMASALPEPAPSQPEATVNPIVTSIVPPDRANGVLAAAVPNRGEARLAAVAPAIPKASPPAARTIGAEDDVIAAIVRGIVIPASELGVAPLQSEAPPPAPTSAPVEPVAVPVAKPPAPKAAAPKPAPAKAETPKPAPKAAKKPAPAPKPPAEPARHWVQVAGGANVADLPKAWKKLVDKAPAAMKGRSAWTTPLRFTNRLLTGPFKTDAEAQAFVNTLTKAGLSGFAWTSEAGQKVAKLPAK